MIFCKCAAQLHQLEEQMSSFMERVSEGLLQNGTRADQQAQELKENHELLLSRFKDLEMALSTMVSREQNRNTTLEERIAIVETEVEALKPKEIKPKTTKKIANDK